MHYHLSFDSHAFVFVCCPLLADCKVLFLCPRMHIKLRYLLAIEFGTARGARLRVTFLAVVCGVNARRRTSPSVDANIGLVKLEFVDYSSVVVEWWNEMGWSTLLLRNSSIMHGRSRTPNAAQHNSVRRTLIRHDPLIL